jgi:hypothetical protein
MASSAAASSGSSESGVECTIFLLPSSGAGVNLLNGEHADGRRHLLS